MDIYSFENLFVNAIRAAQAAGEAIMRVYSEDFKVDIKDDQSPVTIADMKAQDSILPYLEISGIPVISEEAELPSFEERMSWEEFWLVDPLDGTKEFIHRNGEFTVNIALISGRRPIMGVVYSPATDELFAGWVGKGAWRLSSASRFKCEGLQSLEGNGLVISAPESRTYTIAVSRSHSDAETIAFLERTKEQRGGLAVIKAGSSMKFCLVAACKADEYPRFGPTREWDTAAGHAILLATGKDIYRLSDDRPLEYNKEDLTNPGFVAR